MTKIQKKVDTLASRTMNSYLPPFVKKDPSPVPLPKRTVSYRLLDEEQRIKDSGYVPEFLPPEIPYTPEDFGGRRVQPLSKEGQILQFLERISSVEEEAVAREAYRERVAKWWEDYQHDHPAISKEEKLPRRRRTLPPVKYTNQFAKVVAKLNHLKPVKKVKDPLTKEEIVASLLMAAKDDPRWSRFILKELWEWKKRAIVDKLLEKSRHHQVVGLPAYLDKKNKYSTGGRFLYHTDNRILIEDMAKGKDDLSEDRRSIEGWRGNAIALGRLTQGKYMDSDWMEYCAPGGLYADEVQDAQHSKWEDLEVNPYRGEDWYANMVYGNRSLMGTGSKRPKKYSIVLLPSFARSMTLAYERDMWIDRKKVLPGWEPKDVMKLWHEVVHDRKREARAGAPDPMEPMKNWLHALKDSQAAFFLAACRKEYAIAKAAKIPGMMIDILMFVGKELRRKADDYEWMMETGSMYEEALDLESHIEGK